MDAVWKFYCTSIKTHHQIQNIANSNHPLNITTLRNHIYKEYGIALGEFMRSVVPHKLRSRRDFRLKFAEDMDFDLLENSLISAAHRIVYSSQTDPSMNSCLPNASEVTEKIDMLHISLYSHLKSIEGKMRVYMAEKEEEINEDEEYVLEKWLSDYVFGTRCVLSKYQYHKSEIPNVPSCLRDFLYISNDIIDLLTSLDATVAKFEWKFVKMVARRIRSKRESHEIQKVCVLFSETIQWAQTIGLISKEEISDRDPVLFLCLPRLVLIFGLRILHDGPISYRKIFSGRKMPYIFHSCLPELASLARQLLALSQENLYILIRWIGPSGMPNIAIKYTNSESQKYDHFQGLHYVYKKISKIADTLCSRNASDIRFLMQNSIEMNDFVDDGDLSSLGSTEPPCPTPTQGEEKTQSEVEEDEYLLLIERVSKFSLVDWRDIMNISQNEDLKIFPMCPGEKKQRSRKMKNPDGRKESEPLEVGFDIAKWLQEYDEGSGNTNLEITGRTQQQKELIGSLLNSQETNKEKQSKEPTSLPPEEVSSSDEEPSPTPSAQPSSSPRPKYFLPLWQPNSGLHLDLYNHEQGPDSPESSGNSDDEFDIHERLPVQGSVCGICLDSFNLFRRRHHCRRCGFVFCDWCSHHKRILPHSPIQLFRVCNDCNEFLGPEVVVKANDSDD